MIKEIKGEIKISGISGSPGICIGKAYLVDQHGVDVVEKYLIPPDMIQNEVNRFKVAVSKAKNELAEIIANPPEELVQHIYILETHMVMHEDKMLYGKTIETIENEKVNAEWALKKVVSNVKAMFQNIQDPYLKSRSDDVVQVSDRIMRNLVGIEENSISEIDKRVVLVAKDLSPADTSQIQLEKIKGFVTDKGGPTSHTSIIARTLGIPSVLGLGSATKQIDNDDVIIIDGITGVIIINPADDTTVYYEERRRKYEAYKSLIAREAKLAAVTSDGVNINLMGNIELAEEIVSVRDNGGDGIGLFRTEFLYMQTSDYPTEDELYEQYRDVVELMAPHPVTIRTLDINGDKGVSYMSDIEEENPALGLRAIRYCLKRPDVFMTQLRAILRASAFGAVRILFPMIANCEEVEQALGLLDEAAESLEREGIEYDTTIEKGIMIEVPSAVIMADAMADMVDFFSIGTNDLVQYSLAIDRGNRQVAYLYNSLNPAVLRMLKHIVDIGREKGVKVSMCGEMAGYPEHMPVLLGLGIEELSMTPLSIPGVKNTIRSLKINECRDFVKEVLKKTTTDEITDLIEETYGDIMAQKAYMGD